MQSCAPRYGDHAWSPERYEIREFVCERKPEEIRFVASTGHRCREKHCRAEADTRYGNLERAGTNRFVDYSIGVSEGGRCVLTIMEVFSRTPIPRPDPNPEPDPEPWPGSDPDVVPPINPDPEPGSTPDVFPPTQPDPVPA